MSTADEFDQRPAAHAGRFYPGDKAALRAEVRRCINAAPLQTGDPPPLGFVAPHAGYAFSGPTAGHAYRQIQAAAPRRVFVFAPSHHGHFLGVTAWRGSAYATPLGACRIDRETVDALRGKISFSEEAWADEAEHALEVQVPFIQESCPDAALIPLLVGDQSFETCADIAKGVGAFCSGREGFGPGEAVFVASSDCYHGHSLEKCLESDARLAEAVRTMDVRRLYEAARSEEAAACGLGPIAVVMQASKALGATQATILDQRTSADAMARGRGDYVVGYMAAMFD